MRLLPLLLLTAACSSRSAPQEAPAPEACPSDLGPGPGPAAPPPPVAPPPPPPAAATPAAAPDLRALLARCPVGDLVNVTVYGFLERELEEAAAEDGGRAATRAILAREAELLQQPDMKPRRASIIEGETSHVLAAMCRGTPGCKAVGLYNASGLAIALSFLDGHIAPLGFDDARWAALAAADPDGAVLALSPREAENLGVDRHALAVFRAGKGIAACIIER